ncbi:MAG: hypothetical protein U0237_03310 [Thermoleophilia bacterium]
MDFSAAWGAGDDAPPELPRNVWDTIAAGERLAGLVEPKGTFGRLTAVMAMGPRDAQDYAAGAVGFRLRQGNVVALTFLPGDGRGRGPVDVEFDVHLPDDRAVMIELIGQQAMTAMWIDVSEMLVVRRANLALDGARRIVTQALAA